MKSKAIFGLQVAIIALAGWWVALPSLRGTWLWDDDTYITDNAALRSPGGLWRIWFDPPGVNYFPVTFTAQWLQWNWWGNDPLGYHCTNVALQLISCFLIWRLLQKLGLRRAWLGGLLFAVHPVTVESVGWISELKNTLSLPPLLLGMIAYVDFDAGKRSRYYAALFWFVVAMLCKSTVVMFPFVLLLYAWWRRARLQPADFRAGAAFFAVALILGLVTVSFEHRWMMAGFDDTPRREFSTRAAAAGMAMAFYFSKFVFPAELLPTYPRWMIHPAAWWHFLPWMMLAVIILYFWAKRTTWGRTALFGLGSYGLTLSPILGFVPMSYNRISWVADHFMYLPLVSLVGLVVAALDIARFREAAAGFYRPALAAAGATGLAIAALAWESHHYAAIFASRQDFWAYTLQRNPNSWGAHNDLGTSWVKSGQTVKAIAEFEQAIRLEPSSAVARNNLGAALVKVGRLPEAVAQYERVLQMGADYAGVHYNLALALAHMGRSAKAIEQYRHALVLRPQYPEADNNLGAMLLEAGKTAEGIARLEEAVRLRPDYIDARSNLGAAFAQSNRLPEAIAQYEEVLRLDPKSRGMHARLGDLLAESGKLSEAAANYEAALEQTPGTAAVHYNLGLVLRALGKEKAAAVQFEQAGHNLPPASADSR